MNTEIADIESWLPAKNTGQGVYESLVATFLSTNQYITWFYVCLFKDNWMYIVGLVTLKSQLTTLYIMPEKAYLAHIFSSTMHVMDFLRLETLDCTSAL